MKTYTITIDESIISMDDILTNAWLGLLETWSRENTLAESKELRGITESLSHMRRAHVEEKMSEVARITSELRQTR